MNQLEDEINKAVLRVKAASERTIEGCHRSQTRVQPVDFGTWEHYDLGEPSSEAEVSEVKKNLIMALAASAQLEK